MVDKKQNVDEIRSVLEGMRQEYWQSLEEVESEAEESREFLIFQLGKERFGIAAETVREVVRMPARLVPVPKVAAHIRGVFNLRGQILAVTDLGCLLGLSASGTGSTARLLVVEAAGLNTALLAETVEGLRRIVLADIEPVTAGLGNFPREDAEGQVVETSGLVVLLNLERIFSRPDFVVNEKVD
jgi:purine-binding chemotaxis protein CheW